MAWKEFELQKVVEDEPETFMLPYSSPATIAQDANEILHGDAEADLQGDTIDTNIKTKNLETASHHIVKEVLDMDSFPKDKELALKELDGESLNTLKNHYLQVDLMGKNSGKSGGEQSSSEKQ